MITVISTIKTTIKTHITITRGALIALFAGLFILAACGGGGGAKLTVDVTTKGAACANPFDPGCGDAGAAARAEAIDACRLLIETGRTCADTIPAAALACLTDPYGCDVAAYTAEIRTETATVLIGALQTGRTNDCRGRTVAGALLCNGAIDNTCLPFSTTTGATRNGLVLDNLCNNAPNYLNARTDFVADCTDRDLLNNEGCSVPQINTCTKTPFNAGCDIDVYDSYRAESCNNAPVGTAHARCATENIIANYCADNIFGARAGCSTNSAFAAARITECITGNNGRSARCQNTGIFTTAGLTECFEDPYGNGCDTALGGSLNVAQSNHKTYCTGLIDRGVLAKDNTICDAAISNVCAGNIFDPLCFEDNYQTEREATCQMGSDDVRCPATVAQLCATNPFTQKTSSTGGGAGYLCTDANARVAFIARCASDRTVCAGINVGNTALTVCIDDPYLSGCGDVALTDLRIAHLHNCTRDVLRDGLDCTTVESRVCHSGSDGRSGNNPFFALCRTPGNTYGGARTVFCGRGSNRFLPECATPNFERDCNANPFATACLRSNSYATDRATIISDCLDEIATGAVDTPNCDGDAGGGATATVGQCAVNPFDTANGCDTNVGFDATRTARTALCAATATTLFDSLCNNFPDIATARTTHCTTAETSFAENCNDPAYPKTDDVRTSFCTQPANLFNSRCKGVTGVSNARTALALACFENAASAGCSQFVNGVSGLTIAQCSANPFNTANDCHDNTSFIALRTARTTLCETSAQYFNPLCTEFRGIDTLQEAYCTNGAGSFDANCELNYADGAATARRAFARLCRSATTPRDDCANTRLTGDAGSITVAQCVANPYRRECYGTEDNRNQDFIEEVEARDALCTGGDVYSDLCLLGNEEIVAGVNARRVAGCTTPALAAFNDNCTETAYVGTEAARREYCSTDAQRLDAQTRCLDFVTSICGADIAANPFAAICADSPNNAANRMTFCGLPNNTSAQCTNDAIRLCPDDPFNSRAGISGTVNCLTDFAYTNDRAERCAAGTQGAGECNETNIVTRVCVEVGRRANPFAAFCATATGVVGDLNASKTTFANACTTASASVYCNTSDVKTALCSGSGDFLRPFSAICTGQPGLDATRISFCGTGDNGTEVTRCNDIIVADCRTDPFSSSCESSAPSVVAELRDLRAAHCESLTVADDLCSTDAVMAVCEGYTGASGAVVVNPLSGLCAEGYVTERFNACLGLNSKNTVCDGIPAVVDKCRENPFDASNPGCALLTAANDLKKDYCKGPNTWLGTCDKLAEVEVVDGVNEIVTARLDACVEGSSGTTAQCTGLASIMMACETTPFGYGCRGLIATDVLAGYQLAYCQTAATAWDDECDELDAASGNTVGSTRGTACGEATQADDADGAGYFNPRCNTRETVKLACGNNPFAAATPGCALHADFEEFATNYCTASGTTWMDDCDTRAEATEGNNVVSIARRDACLASADVMAFPDMTCATITNEYCSDTDNSANAFDAGCGVVAVYPEDGTTRAKQLQKACAEGGMNANTLCSDNDNEHAKVYCRTIDPYAGIGCEELAADPMVMTFRTTYCTTNTELPECSDDIANVCMANPFDARCVDDAGVTTYAEARKARADACVLDSPVVDCTRVNACNDRPFSVEIPAHLPTGAATTCSTDPAFVDIRAALITKCIVLNAVQTDQDCKDAVADGVNCLTDPYANDDFCMSAAQLGSAPNVATAKASFCRTTTGSNSFNDICANSGVFPSAVKQAQVDSCLHSDSVHGDCPMLITAYCTDTDEGFPLNDRCTGRTGNTFARVTLCVNGTEHANCPTIGASFTAWTEADTADTGAEILDAGAGDTDVNANFIKGVLNADGTLYLGDNPDDVNIIATTHVIRLNNDYTGDGASATPLRGDAEDGFVFATADVADDGVSRFFVGILHTTDLGAPITDSRGRALWKGVIQAFRYDGTNSYIHNADFVLRVDFDAGTLAFDDPNGVVTLLGGATITFSITTGTFDKTTGLITGEVLFEDNTVGSSKESTGILRGVIGREGAVGVFASPSTTGTFGDFVGGFVASSADKLPICVSLIEDPFGDNCSRTDSLVLAAQLAACSTGLLGSNTPVNPADCNDAALSGVICSDDITPGSDADPFSRICSDDAITIVSFSDGLTDLDGDTTIDLDDVRQKVRTYCDVSANSQQTVCIARRAQIDALSGRCIAANEPNLFGDICSSYREFGAARALLCRNRADTTSTTHNTYNCDTKDIIAHLCAGNGAAANPFDEEICGTDGTHAGARQGFAARCAQDLANDPTATGNLNGAVCLGSGLNTPCLIDPFSTGVIGDSTCKEHADYDAVREDRKIFCRGSEAVKYKEGNIFDYECRSAVVDVCGSASAPKDVDLFSDRLLCAGEGYDTRRAAIVRDCAAAAVNNPEDANCQFEIVGAVTRLVNMTDDITGVTTQVPEIVTPAKKVGDCIIDPYDVECAHAAFGNQRTAVLGGCETAFTGAGCLKVQENVCGGGIYAGDPFDAFCDKKDTADPTLTIAPETLADGRNKYCQIGTNATSVQGCAEFLNRPTTAALLKANPLDDSPDPVREANQFLRGTADGLNTGGFIQKNGSFAFVSTLNLGTATYAQEALGGDTADGVAFFAGRRHSEQGDVTTDVDYYAGIHSGTDLGNPLPSQYGTDGGDLEVEWNGRIGWLIYDPDEVGGYAFGSKANGIKDFKLTINLTARTIFAYIFHANSLNRALGFLLNGDYDENGVIDGTAQYGISGGGVISEIRYSGDLIGLIGEQGAVGAFHLTGNGAFVMQGASGGFVVSSSTLVGSESAVPVEGSFNHWLAKRKDNDGNPINVLETIEEVNQNAPNAHFIVGGGDSTALGKYPSGNRQARLVFGTASSNGLVFGFDNVDGGVEKFYTGLLVGANLGTPLTETAASPSVTWNGRISIAKQDPQGTNRQSYLSDVVNFKLNIVFTDDGGTFSTPKGVGERITFMKSIYDASGTGDQFVLSGKFDSQGVLSGTTTYFAINGGLQTPLGGILTGLIGINGVAGVFASNAAGSDTVGHYTGGFIASESFGLGGAEYWQAEALAVNGTDGRTINNAETAALADGDYTFIGGGSDTLLLGVDATKSTTLTQDLTFNENLTLQNGDVFSLNNVNIPGGVSFAQATVGGERQFYAGLLSNTFVGVPLAVQPSVINWRGVLGIIVGATPALYTTDFTLAVNFSTKSVFSNAILPQMAGNLNHNIIIEGRFGTDGIIYGTATYDAGGESNTGELTGLIGTDSVAAVFGGNADNAPGRFVGGFVAVPTGTSTLRPNSHIAWETGIDETVVNGARFDGDVGAPAEDSTDSISLDTTSLGGLDNADRTADGFSAFTITETINLVETTTHRVGILSGTDLGGPVVDTGGTGGIGFWHARVAGLIITAGVAESFSADFTLRLVFGSNTMTVPDNTKPSFVAADETEFSFSFPATGILWNENTGVFTGGITLNADVGEATKDGILRGIIGEEGAVATFRVSQTGGTRTFVGGFVAVPESIGAARGQTPYWVEYARNADNTDALEVRAVRTARPTDGEYTVIEGGLETLELGLEVAKNAKADLTYDLTFNNTVVLPDGSTTSLDPSVAGGISFSALETIEGKFYTGLLSGTDVGRLQSRSTPSAIWVGRFGIITGTTTDDNKLRQKDFELAINFADRTLKTYLAGGTAGVADRIVFFTVDTVSAGLIIDGKFNDRGIIYGTTNYRVEFTGGAGGTNPGILTGLIGEKGAAGVFYSSSIPAHTTKYVGGFIAVPDRGALTRVSVNTLASYNVWTNSTLDKTTQQSATSTADGATASTANTAAFTTEVPETPPNTAQISLNMAPLGGDVGDGLIGYAGTTARLVGLLPSTNLGGLPIYTGTATWSGVMQWILGDGTTGVFTQGFTLNVNFDDRTLALADMIRFASGPITYDLTLDLMPWDEDSGLVTGTISIASTAITPQQISAGDVRGIIGVDGVVAAFRSTDSAVSSFTGGFVAAEVEVSETSFTEHFSSEAGGELLQDTVVGEDAKFARANESGLLGETSLTTVYRLGELADSPSGFVVSTLTANLATGILSTTDLGAPLPLTLATMAEWTGKLFISNAGLKNIVLNVEFAPGTIKTKTAIDIGNGSTLEVDGYFGLNPLALAADLPLGLLGGVVNYRRTSAPTLTALPLIGQIGAKGVVAVFSGVVNTVQIVGGFQARSSGATANGREFSIKQRAGTNSYRPNGSIDYSVDDFGNPITNGFIVADKNGSTSTFMESGFTTVVTSQLFGLGGDNDPATNRNGFSFGQGTYASVKRIGAGIWADADLGLLLPTTAGSFATWTGTLQTLKIAHGSVGSARQSDFTIQVDFENSTISTLGSDGQKGAINTTDCISAVCDTIRFDGTRFDANGIIKANNAVQYKIGGAGTGYNLALIGLIGQNGALGVFHGNLASGTAIVGGFEVSPTPREINPDIVVVEPVIPPKQINYDTYLQYYQTDYTSTRHGPGISDRLLSKISQFLQSVDNGSALGPSEQESGKNENFEPFTVYLNGEGAATRNGFVLVSGSALDNQDSAFRNFAGLLAGADVGRFSDALTGTAEWSGSFYSSAFAVGTGNGRAPARFAITLNVDFSAGLIATDGEVPLLNEHSINIAGTFGFAKGDITQGIIGGFITYTNPNAVEEERITKAPIYGIIGDAGALGVFAGGKYGADGDGADSPLVGGFEVSPNPVPTANYALFENYFSGLGSGDTRLIYDRISQFNPPRSHFVKGTATGLVLTGLETTRPLTGGAVRLGGDKRSNSGFALLQHFTPSRPRGHTYAGLLTGTNLGAVLPVRFGNGRVTAIWHGSFYTTNETNVGEKIRVTDATVGIVGRGNLVHAPLSVTVDLSAGTLQTVNLLGNLGAVALSATDSVQIDAQFGLNARTAKVPYGILLGTVTYNKIDYTLAGLIGVDGAIGIFRRNIGFSTVGGFEVSPPPPPAYGRADYATFEDFYHRSKSNTDDLYLAGSITAGEAQFVRGTPTGLVKHNLTGDLEAGSFAPLTVYLGGDVTSGNAFVLESFNGTNVAGLLSTTDLGFAPHESVVSATWEATFYVSSDVNHTGTDRPAPEGFIIKDGVEVDFAAGTLTSTQETYTLANAQFISFGIYGRFGERQHELPLGILDGIVKYGHHATDASLIVTADLRDLPLIGVIGREGALGVFHDPSDSNNLIGGFEAGYNASYGVWLADIGAVGGLSSGFDPNLSPTTCCNNAIQKTAFLKANDAGTGLISDVTIDSYAGTTYRLGDVATNPNGFILAGGTITTVPASTSSVTAGVIQVVGAGLLPTINLGPTISDVVGSASWEGKAYVIDTRSTTTKVFELTFNLNFATGTFSTGANPVAVEGGGTQTLKIEGIFGQGLAERPRGLLNSRGSSTDKLVTYFDSDISPTATRTSRLTGLIGRDGLVGMFTGGGNSINQGFIGGFWAGPSTAAPKVNYAAYLGFYGGEITDTVTISTEPGTAVRFLDTSPVDSATTGLQSKSFFELGKGTSDTTVTDGLFSYVYSNVKVIGITTTTDLGAVLPINTASATWYGRLFAKTDATAFNLNNDKQISLDVDFAQGTIDTPRPVEFTVGEQTHTVSVRGRFGLNSFARDSKLKAGLLGGFVEYTHHGANTATKFDLIGLIGEDGALGIFKGRVAGVNLGLIGGFEASPDTGTYIPDNDSYLKQFGAYINDQLRGGDIRSQIAKGEAHNVKVGNTPNYQATFRLGGLHSHDNNAASGTNIADGFAFAVFTPGRHKGVGILSGTDLGAVVTPSTPSAIWAGRLYVNPAYTAADTAYAKLDLRVNFGAGTIETLAPISIVAYKGGSPSTRKQTLEIEGIFGSHLDAHGLRTGTLGGSIIYKVGHLTPTQAAAVARTATYTNDEVTKHSVTTAYLPLRGLIGADGAIGVFHGTVSDVHVIGGFEVSPRAEITTTTASFGRWARGATQCETIDQRVRTIDFDTNCATKPAIAFIHPNDIFESDDDFESRTRARLGFVLGGADSLDFSDILSPPLDNQGAELTLTPEVLTLGDDTLVNTAGERFTLSDAQAMDEDGGADGVAFIDIFSIRSSYAGLLSGTDLGAPLTTSTVLAASWPGRFAIAASGSTTSTNDFLLEVDFVNSRISWTQATAGGYALQGSYDANGIITGVVKGKQAISGGIYFTGHLTGLIGEQGAVGAFIIDSGDRQRVGGFVAAPVTKVKATSYAHFEDYHKTLTGQRELHADLTTGGEAALVVGTPTGLNTTTATGITLSTTGAGEFSSTYYLGGGTSGDDGFALLRGRLTGSNTHIYRAGILSGTDLGPVVNARVNGLWTGTAYIIHTSNTASRTEPFATEPLIFDVDFAAGTIRTMSNRAFSYGGVLTTTHSFGIDGRFGEGNKTFAGAGGGTELPPGILGGGAYYAFALDGSDRSTLSLSGLIGAEGAIGVFANEDGGSLRIAGGFSAQPFALTPAGIAAATPPTDIFASVSQDYATLPTRGSATSGGFVKLGNTLTSANVTNHLPTTFTLDVGPFMIKNTIEFTGGVGYFAAVDDNGVESYHYAGILADTDLGAPRTEAAGAASWTGQFSEHSTVNSGDKNNFVKFHIDFGAGRLQFRNATDTGGNGTLTRDGKTYTLNGEFGNGFADVNNKIITTGQLGGRITRTSDNKTAAISGLIGEYGVVGAFVNTDSLSVFAGGFWAVETIGEAPDGDAGAVNFADWSDGFGREHTLPSRLNAGKSQFLEGLAAVTNGKGLDETGVSISARFVLTFDNDSAAYKGSPLGGNGTAADGVSGILGGNGNRYVGLLSGTNLGAPIRSPSHVGMWRGQFVAYGQRSSFDYRRTSDNVVLAVTYDTANRDGTIKIVNPSCRTASKSCINSPHFTSRYYEMVNTTYNDRGVISGEIRYHFRASGRNGYAPAILTGLIGRDGAVGAFISGRGTIDSIGNDRTAINPANGNDWNNDDLSGGYFFGGFVATSHIILETSVPDSFVPNYAHFEYYYTNFGQGGRRLPSFAVESGTGARIAFLTGTATGLDDTGIDNPTTDIYRLGKAVAGDNGFAFVNGAVSGNRRYRVGLLSGTDLGAAFVSRPMILEWAGSVRVSTVADPDIILSADGTFTLDFDAGTITSPDIAIGTASDTIRIAGTFRFGSNINKSLGAGILGGSAFFNTTALPLIGLIGEAGALGVFTDGMQFGGFEAGPPPPAVAGEAKFWLENALDADGTGTTIRTAIKADVDAVVGDPNGGFATADGTRVTLGDSVLVEDFAVRLGDLDGNDNATSGFAIGGLDIANPAPSTSARRVYVGILSGTDVGAPLPFMAENDPTAEWKGLVSLMSGTLRDYRNVPITLDVGFDGTAGTITTRSGGVNFATNEDLIIAGKFGANGVIYGTATFNFIPFGDSVTSYAGALTGLIGMDSAVGVFSYASSSAHYVGGFVAIPRPADLVPLLVNYADWAGATAITPLASGAAEPSLESRFLTSTGDRLDTEDIPGNSTSVNLSTATNGGTALGGDTTDGFAYRAVSGVNDIFLVGITETTDLGAPLDATTVLGTWKGSFVSVVLNSSVPASTTTDFTLAVTFGDTASGNAGSVASGTIGATGYAFTGEFDSRGVISGTTTHAGNGGGILQGLIGAQGAVGVFISNVGATKAYGGGFVAKPTPPPPPDPCIALRNCPAVEFAAWEASFTGGVNASETLQLSGFKNAGSNNSNYIKLTDDNKIKIMNATDVERTFTPNILRLNETVDADGYESGIAYTFNNQDYNGQTYAGILATTNLGAPLTDGTKDGRWTGRLGGEYGSDTPIGAASFSMQVTWNGSSTEPGSMGTIKSLPSVSSTTPGAAAITGAYNEMNFSGDFNAAGVMWGDVALGTASANDGTFSGLIGAKGAVGVFRGIDDDVGTTPYAGGFEVKHVPSP